MDKPRRRKQTRIEHHGNQPLIVFAIAQVSSNSQGIGVKFSKHHSTMSNPQKLKRPPSLEEDDESPSSSEEEPSVEDATAPLGEHPGGGAMSSNVAAIPAADNASSFSPSAAKKRRKTLVEKQRSYVSNVFKGSAKGTRVGRHG